MPESNPVSIRRATAEDLNLLVDLGARTFTSAFAEMNTQEDMANYLATSFNHDQVARELADQGSIFFIAQIQQVAIGYAKLRNGPAPECVKGSNPVELERLYTLPEQFGKGTGKALMEACLAEARQMGYGTVWLGVWEHNDRARAFYHKFGFRDVGNKIFQLGSDPQTDKVMECVL